MIAGLANTSTLQRVLMSSVTPVVFVVDDDISVRESLAGLIHYAGWQVETFASAEEFLARPVLRAPSCSGTRYKSSGPQRTGPAARRIALDRIDMPIIFIIPMATATSRRRSGR